MADNVQIDPGTTPSVTVSTDDAGAAGHVQRVKLALSADGSAAHATVTADGVLVDLGSNNDVTVSSSALPSGAATAANQSTLITYVDGIEALLGTIDADTSTLAGMATAATATLSAVNDTATSTSLLAQNTSRKGVILVNDSTTILYLKYGATASTTSYTVKLNPGDQWEMPTPIYTGAIDGIWSADASGAARITELT